MKRIAAALCLMMMAAMAPGHASDAATALSEEQRKQVLEEINLLTAQATQIAVNAVLEHRTFYPFAMFMRKDGKAEMLGWSGEEGEPLPKPEEWALGLYFRLREMAREQPDIISSVVVRMANPKSKEGDHKVPGIMVQSDHRLANNGTIMFVGFPMTDEGTREMADPVYNITRDRFFPDD